MQWIGREIDLGLKKKKEKKHVKQGQTAVSESEKQFRGTKNIFTKKPKNFQKGLVQRTVIHRVERKYKSKLFNDLVMF